VKQPAAAPSKGAALDPKETPMKKLVLGSLLLAALVSQTTGCIFVSDDDDVATITADWSFRTVGPAGMLSPENNCPAGYPEVALHTQELDATDRPVGAPVVDVFDCDRGSDFSDGLVPSTYEAFIRVTGNDGTSVYAESLAEVVDVSRDDVTIHPEIIDNGGYFKVAWNLRKNGAAVTCSQVPGLDKMSLDVTPKTGPTPPPVIITEFDCDRGFDISNPAPAGPYGGAVHALDTAKKSLGEYELTQSTMADRNKVVDLGTVVIDLNP
jgi:hypothetical protein